MTVKCPQCRSENPDDSSYCRKCATPLIALNEAAGSLTKLVDAVERDLTSGTVIARKYRILDKLGAGGMGEVYQAEDLSLNRQVAIKVLPAVFAADRERLARFEREAKILASLNHPNIAAIYGVEQADAKRFLVLELVEGETLSERLLKDRPPLDEILEICRQIAEGLESAHEKGIIHRDLKPSNVKITPQGKVKILDFGLAMAFHDQISEVDLRKSPTITADMTKPGVILGTAAYMSPEQAKGKAVDRRADIWAFGCVLFEMLTGRAAFPGKDVTEILAAVIRGEPEWGSLPANLHWRLREVLERCLTKELRDRYHDISDVRVDLQKVLSDPSGVLMQPVTITEPRKKLRLRLPWVAATAVLSAVVVGVAIWNLRKPEPRQVIRFDYELPEGQEFSTFISPLLAVSPDGRQFVYSTRQGLYLRSMEELAAKLILGTEEDPQQPFFSPDGQWIGYLSASDGKLKKISLKGGAPVALCNPTTRLVGASWHKDNTIVYGQRPGDIMRISANGGTPESLIKAESAYLLYPQILPDGKSVMYTETTSATQTKIIVQSLKSGERKELFEGYSARYLPTGHIVYMLPNNNVFAIAFDLDRLEVIGGPVPIVEDVRQVAISDSGTLVYIPRTSAATVFIPRDLVWVDREGREEQITGGPSSYLNPRISPDGKKVALSIEASGNRDIWIWDLLRKVLTRLTFDEGPECSPLWTLDGKGIAFLSLRTSKSGVYWKAADGTGGEELLFSLPGLITFPASLSADGKTIVGAEWELGRMNFDIGILPTEGDSKPRLILKERYHEAQPQVSLDGRWMAYTSNESGQNQVYVRPFPEVEGGLWQVSTTGGDSPLWSPDGREIFFRNGDAVMVSSVRTDPTFSFETPKMLFQGTYVSSVLAFGSWDFSTWDINPDGRRFLMMKELGAATTAERGLRKITVVLNWFEELKRLVPTGKK